MNLCCLVSNSFLDKLFLTLRSQSILIEVQRNDSSNKIYFCIVALNNKQRKEREIWFLKMFCLFKPVIMLIFLVKIGAINYILCYFKKLKVENELFSHPKKSKFYWKKSFFNCFKNELFDVIFESSLRNNI